MDIMAHLRAQVSAIEIPTRGPVLSLGAPEIDAALPWGGLPLGALHEVIGAVPSAGIGFVVILLARLATYLDGQVLWCLNHRSLGESGNLYAPGLQSFGLKPENLIIARGQTNTDVLWAMEEGLRSRALVAVLAETDASDLAMNRRLQLAAKTNRVTGFLLRSGNNWVVSTTAVTRWRLTAAPSTTTANGVSRAAMPCWHVALERCRGGTSKTWLMEWRHETTETKGRIPGRLSVVSELRDRSTTA